MTCGKSQLTINSMLCCVRALKRRKGEVATNTAAATAPATTAEAGSRRRQPRVSQRQ